MMTGYAAPITDMRFVLNDVLDLQGVMSLPGVEAADPQLVDQILEEAGRFFRQCPRAAERLG